MSPHECSPPSRLVVLDPLAIETQSQYRSTWRVGKAALRFVLRAAARRDRRDAPLTTPNTTPARVPLSVLRSGDRAVVEFDALARDEAQLLEAMGLSDHTEVRICRSGSPCIIEVAQTRLGLAASVAHRIYATPCGEECPAVRDAAEPSPPA